MSELAARDRVEYSAQPNLQPVVGEISWAKNLVVTRRRKGLPEREFRLPTAACAVFPQLPSPEAIAERLRLWEGQKGAKE